MVRREFIKRAVAVSATAPFVSLKLRAEENPLPALPISVPKKTKIPRWRGFNLLNMIVPANSDYVGSGNFDLGSFREEDFAIIKELGFDFARLPMSCWCWSSESDWFSMDEKVLKQVDAAVKWGREYGVHVNLCFHSAPGYGVIKHPSVTSKKSFFDDEPSLEAFCYQWGKFAERYKGRPSSELSFNLVNEPNGDENMRKKYVGIVRNAVKTIRAADPNRLVCADGFLLKGNKDAYYDEVCELSDIDNFFECARAYKPREITHFRTSWMSKRVQNFPESELSWPLKLDGKTYDIDYLRNDFRRGWDKWELMGGTAFLGEFGCYNLTPAPIANAWFKDILACVKQRNWGWALWRLRGSFGLLDNDRAGVKFENFKGYKLDRELLEILKQG